MEYFADDIHPNPTGHRLTFSLITAMFDSLLSQPEAPASPFSSLAPLPAPLDVRSANFANAHCATMLPGNAAGMVVAYHDPGWAIKERAVIGVRGFGSVKKSWQSSLPGSKIQFEVPRNTSTVNLVYYKLDGAMGMVSVQVDDLPPVQVDGWFPGMLRC